jgi:hypothetical protein
MSKFPASYFLQCNLEANADQAEKERFPAFLNRANASFRVPP